VRQAAAKQASPAACPAWDGVQPANSAFAFVAGVAVLPDCDAWAVGGTNNPIRMLIEKFAGSSWTRQPVSVPKFKTELFSVAATSPDNAWAVGNQHPPGQNIQDLI